MARLSYFNTGLTTDTSIPLEKKACLFYEANDGGIHKDSKGREHKVDLDYLKKLEENTNSAIANGESIYLIDNHKKDKFDPYGYLDSNVYVKEINEQDAAENPKLKNLVGKFALFADKIKITSEELQKKIKEGIKFPNISVGLDMAAMKLKEISMTCMPALANASLFNEERSDFMGVPGVTMNEVMTNKQKKAGGYEMAEELLETFLNVVDNLKYTRDEDLTGGTREAFYQQAMEDFVSKLTDITEIGPDPGYASQTAVQDTINRQHTYAQENGRPQIIGYSQGSNDMSEFTMEAVENRKFTMTGAEAEFISLDLSFGRKKKKGLLRRAAETAGAAALGIGALKYGKKGFKAASKMGGAGLKKKLKVGALAAGRGIKKDFKKGKKFVGTKLKTLTDSSPKTKTYKKPTGSRSGSSFDERLSKKRYGR